MKSEDRAKDRSRQAVEMLGSAIDIKINELTESNRQLKRKIFDLYTIFEISRNFNSVLNYQMLVDSFLLTSLGQVGAASAALYLPDESDKATFLLAKSKGLLYKQTIKDAIRLGGRLADFLMTNAKPITITELRSRFADPESVASLAIFEKGITLPLIIKSELKGLLVIGGKVAGGGFAADDIEFLSILANQFVVALENARLYESERNALRELRIAQKQLVITERQAAIGELSAKIAHEVNNPLSIISNYLRLAGRDIDLPDQTAGHLDVVKEELGRIARIVRQLLDFHRPQKLQKTPLDIREIITDILSLVKWQLVEDNIAVTLDIDGDVPLVPGSSEQLKQVFLNLVINAKDFMPGGGSLKISAEAQDDSVRISFLDSGPGIPPENVSRIFEPFFTTKQEASGTGLGLSVCFGIIKEHDGRILATNAPDGARFDIILPAMKTGEEIAP